MVAYEFYYSNDIGEEHLIGILPERRRNQERVTVDSIMNWVRRMVDDQTSYRNIFFIEVKI